MFLIILLAFYAAIYITSPFITIFHELGHAIAYLVLTKPNKIDVFIGSYGDTKTKLNFKVGKLQFYVKQSFPFTTGGLCRSYKQEAKYLNKIIILIAGPLCSFVIAIIIGIIVFNTEMHGGIKLFCFALILCSFTSLISNLKPRTIKGVEINNDGKQLQFTIRIRKIYPEYISAYEIYLKGEFEVAVEKFLPLFAVFPCEPNFLRPLILSLLQVKNFDEAEKYLLILEKVGDLNAIDYLNRGYLHSIKENHETAVINYRKALKIQKDNLIGLNNLGYELTLEGEFTEGQELLERAIKISPEFAHPYSNLGHLKIVIGNLDEGKELIEKCLELDPNNACAFKHLGIYYLKIANKEQAIINFNRAHELDKSVKVEPFLEEAQLL